MKLVAKREQKILDGKYNSRSFLKMQFKFQDPLAILNDNSGLNMNAVECPTETMSAANLDFPASPVWPTCFVQTVCDDLPEPDANSLLMRSTVEDSVKVGEYVKYACIDKAQFFETPKVSVINFD
jgi:hypothetical protein